MKKIMITLAFCLLKAAGRAQTVADLTEQLYLDKEKLASMKATLQEMYNGYNKIEQGYTHVRDIAKANFSLHQAFLEGLWLVSPVVLEDPRVREIMQIGQRLQTSYQSIISWLHKKPALSDEELDYATKTLATILRHSTQSIEELNMVTADGQLQMTDAQRLHVIDRINTDIKAQYSFLQQVTNNLYLQAAHRQKEAGNINMLKQLYGHP
ncbi:MAG TPA: hypothetical protein VI233_11390, partial [Puia sp.]